MTLTTSAGALAPLMKRTIRHQVLGQDPPDRTPLRRHVSQASTPELVAALEPRVQHVARGTVHAPRPISNTAGPS
jgi:cytochrome P450